MALSLKDKPMASRTGQLISLHSECSLGSPEAFPKHFCHQKACSDVPLLCMRSDVTAEVLPIFTALLSLATSFSLILLPKQLGVSLNFLRGISVRCFQMVYLSMILWMLPGMWQHSNEEAQTHLCMSEGKLMYFEGNRITQIITKGVLSWFIHLKNELFYVHSACAWPPWSQEVGFRRCWISWI